MTRTPILAAMAAVATLCAAAPAAAQDRGTTTVTFSSQARKQLTGQGVRLVAQSPAKLRTGAFTLPVERGSLTPKVALEHRGGITLRRKAGRRTRTVRLTALRSDLRTVKATVGGREVTVLKALGGKRSVAPSTGVATLSAARLAFTAAGAKVVKRGLGVRRLPSLLGSIATDAALRGGAASPGGSGGTGGSGGSGGTGGTGGSGGSTGSGGSGGSGGTTNPGTGGSGGTPANQPLGAEPAVRERPASAATLSNVSIVWHPKESWIRYLASSPMGIANGTNGTVVSEGASEGPATQGDSGSETRLNYDYGYVPRADRGSWTDDASATTALYFGGAVQFRYVEHGIDLTAKEPEIELDGAASRAIFRFVRTENGRQENKRAVMLDLDLPRVAPVTSGGTTTYTRIPAKIAAGTEDNVFAGFYSPGSEFGWVTVSYTR